MPTKFDADIKVLKRLVARLQIPGSWCRCDKKQKWTFRGHGGEVLNWWPSTGTINLQGRWNDQLRTRLELKLRKARPRPAMKDTAAQDRLDRDSIANAISKAKDLIVAELGVSRRKVRIRIKSWPA